MILMSQIIVIFNKTVQRNHSKTSIELQVRTNNLYSHQQQQQLLLIHILIKEKAKILNREKEILTSL